MGQLPLIKLNFIVFIRYSSGLTPELYRMRIILLDKQSYLFIFG